VPCLPRSPSLGSSRIPAHELGNGGPDLRRWGKGFAAWFVFCALLGLGLLGVVVWAVIALVAHFT
jgi:hypothetical protein